MTLPVFPPTIRLVMGYEEEVDLGVERTNMDGGIAKQRPKYSLPIVVRKAKVVAVSFADKTAFDRWYVDDLKGAAWFTYQDPLRAGGTVTARFKNPSLTWTMVAGQLWESNVEIESIGGL
ncbi:hypothetical protein L4D77_00210 [Photobacterium frigidiphilum]|uniref:hypothetical protein n=1 Tax=Photobacterium frigidiphilum TaxID=264736 RepID=UPI003D0A6E61